MEAVTPYLDRTYKVSPLEQESTTKECPLTMTKCGLAIDPDLAIFFAYAMGALIGGFIVYVFMTRIHGEKADSK